MRKWGGIIGVGQVWHVKHSCPSRTYAAEPNPWTPQYWSPTFAVVEGAIDHCPHHLSPENLGCFQDFPLEPLATWCCNWQAREGVFSIRSSFRPYHSPCYKPLVHLQGDIWVFLSTPPRGSAWANTIAQYSQTIMLFLYIRWKKLHVETWGGDYGFLFCF